MTDHARADLQTHHPAGHARTGLRHPRPRCQVASLLSTGTGAVWPLAVMLALAVSLPSAAAEPGQGSDPHEPAPTGGPAPVSSVEVASLRNDLTAGDLRPLTSLPWSPGDDGDQAPAADPSMDEVLERIFLEPDRDVLHAVLAGYLQVLPLEQFPAALDRCIALAGSCRPDFLVDLMLTVWATRDPAGCWDHARGLFDLLFLPRLGWQGLTARVAGVDFRPAPNPDAVAASSHVISESALAGLSWQLQTADLPRDQRVRIVREMSNLWLDTMHVPPPTTRRDLDREPAAADRFEVLTLPDRWFRAPLSRRWGSGNDGSPSVVRQLAWRRMILADPQSAPAIVLASTRHNADAATGEPGFRPRTPRSTLLHVWAMADHAGMMEWATKTPPGEQGRDSPDARQAGAEAALRTHVRAWLMPDADPATRDAWLAEASRQNRLEEDDPASDFLEIWAWRDPAAALRAAIELDDGYLLELVMQAAAFGPGPGCPDHATHHGLGVLRTFDFPEMTGPMEAGYFSGWIYVMEQWSDVDIGECARFGVELLWNHDGALRNEFLGVLEGGFGPWDDGVIDYTVRALRMWAMWRPDEMRQWIEGIGHEGLRAALRALHADPAGQDGPPQPGVP